jgi:hypothetical protein
LISMEVSVYHGDLLASRSLLPNSFCVRVTSTSACLLLPPLGLQPRRFLHHHTLSSPRSVATNPSEYLMDGTRRSHVANATGLLHIISARVLRRSFAASWMIQSQYLGKKQILHRILIFSLLPSNLLVFFHRLKNF